MLTQGNLPFQQNPFQQNPFVNNLTQQKQVQSPKPPEQELPRFLNYYADYSG